MMALTSILQDPGIAYFKRIYWTALALIMTQRPEMEE